MIWEDILKMKNKWGERLDSSDEKYLIKIIDKFMADTEDDFDLSIATAVAMQMHSFFDKGSEVMNQSKELIEAVEFAQDQEKNYEHS